MTSIQLMRSSKPVSVALSVTPILEQSTVLQEPNKIRSTVALLPGKRKTTKIFVVEEAATVLRNIKNPVLSRFFP